MLHPIIKKNKIKLHTMTKKRESTLNRRFF